MLSVLAGIQSELAKVILNHIVTSFCFGICGSANRGLIVQGSLHILQILQTIHRINLKNCIFSPLLSLCSCIELLLYLSDLC